MIVLVKQILGIAFNLLMKNDKHLANVPTFSNSTLRRDTTNSLWHVFQQTNICTQMTQNTKQQLAIDPCLGFLTISKGKQNFWLTGLYIKLRMI